jgi:hypothetical protein
MDELTDILFPDRDKFFDKPGSESLRKLQVIKAPYNATEGVPCVVCKGLTKCSILNGFLLQEKYYPKNLNFKETCNVIDIFGARIEQLVFGQGATFRDTLQCRGTMQLLICPVCFVSSSFSSCVAMVMQYLCLFYGTDNAMYTNYCVYQERPDPVSQIQLYAQRPPCRSFCVQVAMYCANEPDIFIQTCARIACPPIATQCTPGNAPTSPPSSTHYKLLVLALLYT